MIMMSEFRCILGIAILVLFQEIQVGQCCITQQFSNENSVVKLSCSILSFSGTGSWSVDGGAAKTNCAPSTFCTTTVDGNYSFTSDSAGIYVKIDPFSSDEIGKLWKCENAPSFNCTITVSGPPANSGKDPDDNKIGLIVGVSVAVIIVVVVLVVIIGLIGKSFKRKHSMDQIGPGNCCGLLMHDSKNPETTSKKKPENVNPKPHTDENVEDPEMTTDRSQVVKLTPVVKPSSMLDSKLPGTPLPQPSISKQPIIPPIATNNSS